MRGLRVLGAMLALGCLSLALWLQRDAVVEVLRELRDDRSGPRLDYLPDQAQRAIRAARHSGAWG